MANLGRFVDRNPGIRAAGLSSLLNPADVYGTKELIVSLDTAEEAEHQIRALCRRLKPKPYGKRTPRCAPEQMGDILGHKGRKKPFADLQEKNRENSFLRKVRLGQALETYSKPDSVTNCNRTFGQASDPTEVPLYSVVMPPKSAEQVNREYANCHDMHIVSHNHYFPAEQINRRYSNHFSRFNTFGIPTCVDHSGNKMKRCLDEGEEHLKIVKKPQKDLDDRTKAPLGKKFIWYPWKIPENMTFGRVLPRDFDMRSLLENTSPSTWTDKLSSAISHLNQLRDLLQRRDNFNMNQLITVLAKKDPAETRQLPLAQIIQTMRRMNIPADSVKIRTAAQHYQLFVDEGCCEERVEYEELCNLLSALKPLPLVGSISPNPDPLYNKDTTYRDLCADLTKIPVEGRVYFCRQPHKAPTQEDINNTRLKDVTVEGRDYKPTLEDLDNKPFKGVTVEGGPSKLTYKSPIQEDIDNTRVRDVISPNVSTLRGLWPSDFKKMRDKDEMERIFKSFVSKNDFESIWQRLISEHKDPEKMASIVQFRAEMVRFEDENKCETKEKLNSNK